ncbi:carbamoyltransferase HypF [Pararhodobacter marinus]|uniref:carbamoyltransferase HypF n=1 Tax=Pararhodobacter marinus TaxID=2184063 RepID=UPI0035148614
MTARRIRIRGQVQGVGFRPFVWQLAQRFGLTGEVRNDAEGVLILAAGPDLDAFEAALLAEAPPLSRIDALESEATTLDATAFIIAASGAKGAETRVTPDAATCSACADEIRASGRRQGYAFTNCTHCGPRFTILTGLPYDRAQTTMAPFTLCAECRAEYENPADRRFHAQPVACPACGPRLWIEPEAPDPIAEAARRLLAGDILAVKGLGGFHLACDATNPRAIDTLRRRKHRPAKPFALMAPLSLIRRHAALSSGAEALLTDPAAPIVLLPARGTLPDSLAPGQSTLGWMLPYTPLHHVLLDAVQRPLVMTSGNLSGEPQVIDNDEARTKLGPFADAFVMHDRAIARRLDDSVERADPPMILRRARGRVPGTLPLPDGFADRQVVAYGGQMKAAICLVKNRQALLGHHLGELDEALTWQAFLQADADYAALFDHAPEAVATDLHPDYRATRHGTERARRDGLRGIPVQHHHAHLAACLGENLWPRDGGAVAGIILDGTGLGSDGTLWGGEILLGDYDGFQRHAHLTPGPLIGGDRAAREPWRNALVRLDAAGQGPRAERLFPDAPLAMARMAAERGLNAPLSSSAGRLFDAVAAILGLCPQAQSYEGEAAMRLEALASAAQDDGHPGYPFGPGLDAVPLITALCDDLDASTPALQIARRFHRGLARAFAAQATALVEGGQARAVALSGGCYQNPLLLAETRAAIPSAIPVLTQRITPANDGGLALGQALIALAALESG